MQKNTPKDSTKPITSSIRTYARDIANLVSKGVTLTDVALSEQKRDSTRKAQAPTTKKRGSNSRIIVPIAIILILIGIAVVVGSFFVGEKTDPQIVALNVSPLVFANSQEEVSIAGLDRIKIMRKINQKRASVENSLGSITNLYLTNEEAGVKRLVTTEEFLEKIEIKATQAFKRALGDNFMFGVHSFDGNPAYFLFEVDSFDNVFSEALNWERFMLDDLWVMLYNRKPQESTLAQDGESIFNEGFKDVVVKNRDARVLIDENNETILIYSFPDRKHLIIATSESTLIEVVSRLTTGRFKN